MEKMTRKYHDKEAFVTGHEGSSCFEILLLNMVVCAGLHLYLNVRACLFDRSVISTQSGQSELEWKRGKEREGDRGGEGKSSGQDGQNNGSQQDRRRQQPVPQKLSSRRRWLLIGLEFLALVIPMLLALTSILPFLIGPVILLLVMLALSSAGSKMGCKMGSNSNANPNSSITSQSVRKPAFLSIYRSSIYLLTTISILAVDFPLFPRRFCKTEVQGYGLMDLGAASFIIIAGWTACAFSSPRWQPPQDKGGPADSLGPPSSSSLRKVMNKCTPLLLLGLLRLVTNKGLEYQEHVSEYGVHWNFFFTLCFVEGFMLFWKRIRNLCWRCWDHYSSHSLPLDAIVSTVLMIFYQSWLSLRGGQMFIEYGPRLCSTRDEDAGAMLLSQYPMLCSLFSANREGILGLVGYTSLRLISEDVARYCLWSMLPSPQNENSLVALKDSYHVSKTRQRRLFVTSMLFWLFHFIITVLFQIPPSRRSTNLPFILWAMSHNLTILSIVHYIMINHKSQAQLTQPAQYDNNEMNDTSPPIIMEAVNQFGLSVFLTSNILTGLVNLSMDTLNASNEKALIVLLIYLSSVCGVTLLLEQIFLKEKMD